MTTEPLAQTEPPAYSVALDCATEVSRTIRLARVAAREIVALREECANLRIQADNDRRALDALKLKISVFSNSVAEHHDVRHVSV